MDTKLEALARKMFLQDVPDDVIIEELVYLGHSQKAANAALDRIIDEATNEWLDEH